MTDYAIVCSEFVEWAKAWAEVCAADPKMRFHAILCDPPYSLSFMGRAWDTVPNEKWREWGEAMLPILYPGALVLMFGGCYDEATEVLTSMGWKKFTRLSKADQIATLNPATNEIEYHCPIEIVRQSYRGPMYRLRTKKVNLFVTADHKMFVAPWCGHKFQLRLARDTFGKHLRFKKSGIWHGAEQPIFALPGVENRRGCPSRRVEDLPELHIPMDCWLKFFGLYIAEGSATITAARGGNGYYTQIAHFGEANLDEIEIALSQWFSIRRYVGKLRINGRQMWSYLSQFGQAPQKHVPDWLKQLSPRQIRIFLDWYLRGDGDARGRAYTCSVRLRDDLQELALKAGWSADFYPERGRKNPSRINGRVIHSKHKQWRLTINKRQNEPNKNPHSVGDEAWVDFDGEVYCVEVPNHIIYVRRGGKAVWCGNTRTWHRLAAGMEDAGFEIWDTVMWLYGQGFPKAQDISKLIDKSLGEVTAPASEQSSPWSGHKTCALKPAWEPILCFRAPSGGKTYAELAMEYGSGALNIDAGRVKVEGEIIHTPQSDPKERAGVVGTDLGISKADRDKFQAAQREPIEKANLLGRYPANLVIDENAAEMLDSQAGDHPTTRIEKPCPDPEISGHKWGTVQGNRGPRGYDESGGPARFFYCAKASRSEREAGLDDLALEERRTMGRGLTGISGDRSGGGGKREPIPMGESKIRNSHPTIKPISLCRWLASLLLPPPSVSPRRLLVPFAGTGSEMIGALQAGWDEVIGVEQGSGYVKIGEARLKFWADKSNQEE